MLTSEVRPAEARFELTLAFHCAPALAGIKPADLIALPGEGDETDALLASYSAALAGAGISLRPLCRCRSRCLVLVYRRDRLERQLEQEEVARLLERDIWIGKRRARRQLTVCVRTLRQRHYAVFRLIGLMIQGFDTPSYFPGRFALHQSMPDAAFLCRKRLPDLYPGAFRVYSYFRSLFTWSGSGAA